MHRREGPWLVDGCETVISYRHYYYLRSKKYIFSLFGALLSRDALCEVDSIYIPQRSPRRSSSTRGSSTVGEYILYMCVCSCSLYHSITKKEEMKDFFSCPKQVGSNATTSEHIPEMYVYCSYNPLIAHTESESHPAMKLAYCRLPPNYLSCCCYCLPFTHRYVAACITACCPICDMRRAAPPSRRGCLRASY